MAKRLKGMGAEKYQNDGDPRTSGPGFGITTHPSALAQPYRWTGSKLVCVNSMSDLFHARVPIAFVRDVFDVIRETPQHSYQVLTKRSLRLRRMADRLDWPASLWMGVSVENTEAKARIDDLRETPAAVKFLNCEPLIGALGPLDLQAIHWVIVGGESGPRPRPMDPEWAEAIRDQGAAHDVPFFFKHWGDGPRKPTAANLPAACGMSSRGFVMN